MGFEVPSTGTVLKFPDGSKYAGLEVTVDEVPMGVLLSAIETYLKLSGGQVGAGETGAAMQFLTESFARALEGWNAERNGEPVPATLEGVLSLGKTFVMDMAKAWLTGKVAAGDDLGKDSPSGGSSEAELAAMAASSSSLPSSSPQKF